MLVIDWKKPGFVDVVVQVEAGKVVVTCTTVVTTPTDVLRMGLVIVWKVESTAVEGLTSVAAGADIVIVTTLGFDVLGGTVETPL